MDGEKLCVRCAGEYYASEDGESPRPNARCHMANVLLILLKKSLNQDAAAARHVASFLEHPFRPGSGSRQTPDPCTRRIPERSPVG